MPQRETINYSQVRIDTVCCCLGFLAHDVSRCNEWFYVLDLFPVILVCSDPLGLRLWCVVGWGDERLSWGVWTRVAGRWRPSIYPLHQRVHWKTKGTLRHIIKNILFVWEEKKNTPQTHFLPVNTQWNHIFLNKSQYLFSTLISL